MSKIKDCLFLSADWLLGHLLYEYKGAYDRGLYYKEITGIAWELQKIANERDINACFNQDGQALTFAVTDNEDIFDIRVDESGYPCIVLKKSISKEKVKEKYFDFYLKEVEDVAKAEIPCLLRKFVK